MDSTASAATNGAHLTGAVMSQGDSAMRFLSAGAFVVAAAWALLGAFITDIEEAYITWSDPRVLGLVIFGLANAVAAGLAATGRGGTWAHLAGMVLLFPAVLLMNEAAGTPWDSRWLMIAGAAALVLLGGVLASGLVSGLRRRRSG